MALVVFISYSHRDEALYDQLARHLKPLEYEGVIHPWSDHRISAGNDFGAEIAAALDTANIILLLVSPDFIASEYCWGIEMKKALDRHAAGQARVIPVILRPTDWFRCPFGKLSAVPMDGKPVTTWLNLDEAFLKIATSLRAVCEEITRKPALEIAQSEIAQSEIAKSPSVNIRGVEEVPPVPVVNRPTQTTTGAGTAHLSIEFHPMIAGLTLGASMSPYRIEIDGIKVGSVCPGDTVDLEVAPGEHGILLQQLWAKSNTLAFQISANQRLRLEARFRTFQKGLSIGTRLATVYGFVENISLAPVTE
jgi:hypothetical protein